MYQVCLAGLDSPLGAVAARQWAPPRASCCSISFIGKPHASPSSAFDALFAVFPLLRYLPALRRHTANSALALRRDLELLSVRVDAPPKSLWALRATHLLLCLHYFQHMFTVILFASGGSPVCSNGGRMTLFRNAISMRVCVWVDVCVCVCMLTSHLLPEEFCQRAGEVAVPASRTIGTVAPSPVYAFWGVCRALGPAPPTTLVDFFLEFC